MFPIGDDNIQGAGPSLSTRGLLVVNVLVFVFEAGLASGALENFITEYGVIPREIMSAVDLHTLLTSMFLHGGWMHLIGNMLFLWVFSNNIEAVLGTPLHLGFYLAGGLAASLAHILSDPSSTIPSVGASGAIAAILGTYLMLFPRSRVKLLASPATRWGSPEPTPSCSWACGRSCSSSAEWPAWGLQQPRPAEWRGGLKSVALVSASSLAG